MSYMHVITSLKIISFWKTLYIPWESVLWQCHRNKVNQSLKKKPRWTCEKQFMVWYFSHCLESKLPIWPKEFTRLCFDCHIMVHWCASTQFHNAISLLLVVGTLWLSHTTEKLKLAGNATSKLMLTSKLIGCFTYFTRAHHVFQ